MAKLSPAACATAVVPPTPRTTVNVAVSIAVTRTTSRAPAASISANHGSVVG